MENTIKTEKGIFTIKQRYGEDYKIEMFDLVADYDILYVEFCSDFNLRYEEVDELFKEFEPQIIQVMKFYIDKNIDFYNHFNIKYDLIGFSIMSTPKEIYNKMTYKVSCSKFLKMEIKSDSLEYLKGITHEKKRYVYGFSKTCNFQSAT